MKTIVRIFLLCVLIAVSVYGCYAQVNYMGKGFFSYNTTDTAFVQATRTTTQSLHGNTGVVYFDEIRNKWRIWNGTEYIDLLGWQGLIGNFWPLGGSANLTDNVNIIGGSFAFSGGFLDFNITGSGGGISTAGGNMQFTGIGSITTDVATTYRLQRNGSDRMTVDASGIVTFFPTATQPSFNLGSFAGNPSSIFNGNMWHNSSAGSIGVRVNGNNQYVATIPQTLAANDGRIYYSGSAGGQLQGNSSINISGANRINAPNATFTTDLRADYLGANGVIFDNGTSLATENLDFFYDVATNSLQMRNAAATHTSSLFGGELQIQETSTLDRLTISAPTSDNNADIFTNSGTNLTINATSGTLNLNGTSVAVNSNPIISTSFTPTTVPGANIDGSVAASEAIWFRFGKALFMSGTFTVDATANATLTDFDFTAAQLSGVTAVNAGGVFSCAEVSGYSGIIKPSTEFGMLTCQFTSVVTTQQTIRYTVMYQIP